MRTRAKANTHASSSRCRPYLADMLRQSAAAQASIRSLTHSLVGRSAASPAGMRGVGTCGPLWVVSSVSVCDQQVWSFISFSQTQRVSVSLCAGSRRFVASFCRGRGGVMINQHIEAGREKAKIVAAFLSVNWDISAAFDPHNVHTSPAWPYTLPDRRGARAQVPCTLPQGRRGAEVHRCTGAQVHLSAPVHRVHRCTGVEC